MKPATIKAQAWKDKKTLFKTAILSSFHVAFSSFRLSPSAISSLHLALFRLFACRLFVWRSFAFLSFRLALFRLFALRLFTWRSFVFSRGVFSRVVIPSFRLALFRRFAWCLFAWRRFASCYLAFSCGVISLFRLASYRLFSLGFFFFCFFFGGGEKTKWHKPASQATWKTRKGIRRRSVKSNDWSRRIKSTM